MKVKVIVIIIMLAMAMTGCSDPYGTAAKLAQDVAVSINQADITIDQFRVAGTVTTDEERLILGYLSSLNTLDGTYIACVQAAHISTTKVGGFTACANSLAQAMGDPTTLAALHVSNPASQAKVTAVVQGIVTLVETTITALGGK
jgi:hypothetical protein